MLKIGENVPASKMSFPTAEQFEQNNVQLGSILKWQEVPTEVIHCIERVDQMTTRLGRVAMIISLVDEDETSFSGMLRHGSRTW